MPRTGWLSGRSIRLRRLFDPASGTAFIVPMDHSLADGPIATNDRWAAIVEDIAVGGVDAIIVHKGRVRFLPKPVIERVSIIVHLSGSTRLGPDANAKISVASVEEAVVAGADAVSLHINVGADTESEQLRDFATISRHCERLSIPLLAMIYPRGPRIDSNLMARHIVHAASIAADLGADIVKIPAPERLDDLHDAVDRTPIPVLVAGGVAIGEEAFLEQVAAFMKAGARGLAAGRNIFEADDVKRLAACVASVIRKRAAR